MACKLAGRNLIANANVSAAAHTGTSSQQSRAGDRVPASHHVFLFHAVTVSLSNGQFPIWLDHTWLVHPCWYLHGTTQEHVAHSMIWSMDWKQALKPPTTAHGGGHCSVLTTREATTEISVDMHTKQQQQPASQSNETRCTAVHLQSNSRQAPTRHPSSATTAQHAS